MAARSSRQRGSAMSAPPGRCNRSMLNETGSTLPASAVEAVELARGLRWIDTEGLTPEDVLPGYVDRARTAVWRFRRIVLHSVHGVGRRTVTVVAPLHPARRRRS